MGKDDLKAAAKEILIDTYLELYRDQVVDILKNILAPLSPKQLEQFVADGTAPPIPDAAIQRLKGYEDYIERINPEEVFQWLTKARPDLGDVLISLGDNGAEYVVKLKQFIIDSIKKDEEPSEQMVKLICESCGKDWELTKDVALQVTVCPFCGATSGEETSKEAEEE